MGLKDYLLELDNTLAMKMVSENFSDIGLEKVDFAILYIINTKDNYYAKKYSEWTVHHLDKELKEIGVPHSYAKLIYHIHKVLEKNGLIRTGRWQDTLENKSYIDGTGNKVFLLPTEKGRKCLSALQFLTKYLSQGWEKYKKKESGLKVNENLKKAGTLGFVFFAVFMVMAGLANAECPDPCRSYSGDITGTITVDPAGIYCLCDAADYLNCLDDSNALNDLMQCQTEYNGLVEDYNILQEEYDELNDDKNGITFQLTTALATVQTYQSQVEGMLTDAGEKDLQITNLQGEINAFNQSESICSDINANLGMVIGICAQAKLNTSAIVDTQSGINDGIEGQLRTVTTGQTTQSTKMDWQTLTFIGIISGLVLAYILIKAIPKILNRRKGRGDKRIVEPLKEPLLKSEEEKRQEELMRKKLEETAKEKPSGEKPDVPQQE